MFEISSESPVRQMIDMKCQALFNKQEGHDGPVMLIWVSQHLESLTKNWSRQTFWPKFIMIILKSKTMQHV